MKSDWDRAGNMFVTVLAIITTIWRPGFRAMQHSRSRMSCLLSRRESMIHTVRVVFKLFMDIRKMTILHTINRWL